MSGDADLIVIDALAAIHIARADAYGIELVTRFDLLGRSIAPMLSVVTVGEMLRIARRTMAMEPDEKTAENAVWDLAHELNVVDITGSVQRNFGKLMAMADDSNAPLQHPHGWVAATALTYGAVVISTSRDFERARPLVRSEIIDPRPFFR